MRITPSERRNLIRRLKNRIPRAWRKGVSRPQRLALVIMTNVWLLPGAAAQAKALNTDLILVEESSSGRDPEVFSRSYTKEELAQKSPENPTASFGEVIKGQVTSLLQSVTSSSGNGKLMELYNAAPAVTKSDFALYAAAMRDDRMTQRSVDGDGIRSHMSGQFQGVATDRAVKSNDILTKLKTGMNFNLDMAELFSKKKKSQTQSGTVRYGLILQEINPDPNAPPRAAVRDSVEEQMAYAGQAEVVWTIGPVSEENVRPFSGADAGAPALGSTEAGGTISAANSSSVLSQVKMPSGKFNAKVEGANGDAIKAGPQAGIPAIKYTMSQEQGLYSLMYQTKANFEKDKMEHQFKVPVAGELAFGRRYNDNFEVIQTSAFSVLVDRRAPIVNIHYMNVEDRYAADMKIAKKGHEIGANVDLPAGWKPDDKLGKNKDEKYKVEYKVSF